MDSPGATVMVRHDGHRADLIGPVWKFVSGCSVNRCQCKTPLKPEQPLLPPGDQTERFRARIGQYEPIALV